jgi:hypothetical protein
VPCQDREKAKKMPVISAVEIMKLFLYGKDDLPKFDSEEPIRPLGSEHQLRHYQDFATYMTEGAGRFAVGAASSFVQKFFDAPDRSLFATIKSSPNAI